MRAKRKLLLSTAFAALLGVSVFGGVSSLKEASKPAEVKATDFSSTIRVYVDLTWSNINYVRVGGNDSGNNMVLSSSNSKYNQSNGKYVKDISSSSTYDKMGCFFQQGSDSWAYQYDNGYIWIDDSKFQPGYEFRIYNINWVADGNPKKFSCSVQRLGEIADNVTNAKVYFVDGHSWHTSSTVYAHFWGGTASSTYPGKAMTDSGLRLKAYVGEAEFSGLHIYEYTISGTASRILFDNNSSKTGDLILENNKVYFFGVSAETYGVVTDFLVSLKGQLGSYTYGGKTFTKSICHLSQSEASTFVSTYNDLASNHGSGVASSVEGSGIVTYTSPETSTSVTGEVSLSQIKTALLNKYPAINASGRISLITDSMGGTSTTVIIIAISATCLAAFGGYFLFKKKHQ